MSSGLEDLYGLLLFLHVEPYSNKKVWNAVVGKGGDAAIDMLRELISHLTWRSTKQLVAHELGLPPQTHRVVPLRLSAVEQEFYSVVEKECIGVASKLVAAHQHENGATVLTTRNASAFLMSQLRLRQACCHPQVGGRGVRALRETTMTMEELLEELLAKALNEAEDQLRVATSANNGLAAVDAMSGQYEAAAEVTEAHTLMVAMLWLTHIALNLLFLFVYLWYAERSVGCSGIEQCCKQLGTGICCGFRPIDKLRRLARGHKLHCNSRSKCRNLQQIQRSTFGGKSHSMKLLNELRYERSSSQQVIALQCVL